MAITMSNSQGYLFFIVALIYNALMCFNRRYLVQNMDWLEQSLGDFDDDYVLFDCPGEKLVLNEAVPGRLTVLVYQPQD